MAKFTIVKKCSCGKDIECAVIVPDNLVVTSMSKEYSIKQPETEHKAEGVENIMVGNKNATDPHKKYIKGKIR